MTVVQYDDVLYESLEIRVLGPLRVRRANGTVVRVPGADQATFTFRQLYSVFSPDGVAVVNGPFVRSLDDYLARLEAKFPAQAASVGPVRTLNVG